VVNTLPLIALLIVALLLVLLFYIDLRVGTLVTAIGTIFIPGWWIIAFLLFIEVGLLWYAKRFTDRDPPYVRRFMIFAMAIGFATLLPLIENALAPRPIWNIDAQGKVKVDCSSMASVSGVEFLSEYDYPPGFTANDFDKIRRVSDPLIGSYVTRTDTTNDNYLFLVLRLIKAKFPDGTIHDAWYRVVITDSAHPESSVFVVFVDRPTNRPLMLIRNAAINENKGLGNVDYDCGSTAGILPSLGLNISMANMFGAFMLIPLVITALFIVTSLGKTV
jgi:hypothetical protein